MGNTPLPFPYHYIQQEQYRFIFDMMTKFLDGFSIYSNFK